MRVPGHEPLRCNLLVRSIAATCWRAPSSNGSFAAPAVAFLGTLIDSVGSHGRFLLPPGLQACSRQLARHAPSRVRAPCADYNSGASRATAFHARCARAASGAARLHGLGRCASFGSCAPCAPRPRFLALCATADSGVLCLREPGRRAQNEIWASRVPCGSGTVLQCGPRAPTPARPRALCADRNPGALSAPGFRAECTVANPGAVPRRLGAVLRLQSGRFARP